jgi:hypothetical protein
MCQQSRGTNTRITHHIHSKYSTVIGIDLAQLRPTTCIHMSVLRTTHQPPAATCATAAACACWCLLCHRAVPSPRRCGLCTISGCPDSPSVQQHTPHANELCRPLQKPQHIRHLRRKCNMRTFSSSHTCPVHLNCCSPYSIGLSHICAGALCWFGGVLCRAYLYQGQPINCSSTRTKD